jgi:uncharacterized protein YecT (DUF1311 family)
VEPERPEGVQRPVQRLNWTTISLVGGLVVLVLVIAYFATNRNADQDKLTGGSLSAASATDPEKRCASKDTYDRIKRELFRRAAELRGSDQAAYDKLSTFAVIRMENPVMESEDGNSAAVNCSASLSLDLPPGVAVAGARRTLMSDVDYTVQPAADGSGTVVLLRNADAIIAPLATLAQFNRSAPSPPIAPPNENAIAPVGTNGAAPEIPTVTPPAVPTRPIGARPSFDCAGARSKGEVAVCSDAGLATLDRNLAAQYGRAVASASPEQQALLRRTRDRFVGYRDRCPNRSCVADAYVGRMREVRDIMEGRWSPPR